MRPWGAAMGMYVVGCTKLYPSLTLQPYKFDVPNCILLPFPYITTLQIALLHLCTLSSPGNLWTVPPPPPIVPASENLPRGAWGVVVGST